MIRIEREFQIFAKPVGSLCNLQCNYCYYQANGDSILRNENFRMNDALLENYIVQHIEATTGDIIMFSWHGGEPTLAGIDFYRKAVAFQKKYLVPGKIVVNGIQTNGTLLNNDWCKFLKEENFLICVFDEWVENDIGNITIQIFEEALRAAFDHDHTLCIFKKNCGGVPVIESNGDFYSCDHYVNKKHLLGNISENSVSHFLDIAGQVAFGRTKSLTLPDYCKNCEVLSMCNGECPKNRFITTPDGKPGLNYLCAGYKLFFKHCLPFVETIRKAAADVYKLKKG